MTPRSEQIKSLVNSLDEEYQRGLNDGLSFGYLTAERILVWFLENPKLKEPRSQETLEQWSRNALAELKARIK